MTKQEKIILYVLDYMYDHYKHCNCTLPFDMEINGKLYNLEGVIRALYNIEVGND